MPVEDHARTAQEFLDVADAEFAAGDMMQGSEKMWGAASHAVMAVAQLRGWQFGSHGALRIAVSRLADESGDNSLRGGFSAAERFHANFYHDFIEHDADFDFTKDNVREFVTRMISLMDVSQNGSTG